jgi:hypothetical protein
MSLPQPELPIPSSISVPIGQWHHHFLEPWSLHDLTVERWLRHVVVVGRVGMKLSVSPLLKWTSSSKLSDGSILWLRKRRPDRVARDALRAVGSSPNAEAALSAELRPTRAPALEHLDMNLPHSDSHFAGSLPIADLASQVPAHFEPHHETRPNVTVCLIDWQSNLPSYNHLIRALPPFRALF